MPTGDELLVSWSKLADPVLLAAPHNRLTAWRDPWFIADRPSQIAAWRPASQQGTSSDDGASDSTGSSAEGAAGTRSSSGGSGGTARGSNEEHTFIIAAGVKGEGGAVLTYRSHSLTQGERAAWQRC